METGNPIELSKMLVVLILIIMEDTHGVLKLITRYI